MDKFIGTRKQLTDLSFQSLTTLGIDWKNIVKSNPKILNKFNDYLDKKQEWLMVGLDYAQLELYVLASLSGDPTMIEVVNSGKDLHRVNTENIYKISYDALEAESKRAANAFGLCPSEELKLQLGAAKLAMEDFATKRKCTKSLSFSLTYGASANKIANDLNLTVPEAEKLINDFYSAYPKVKEWQNQSVINAIKLGYIETPFGRRRGTPTLHHNMDAYGAFVNEDKKTINKLYKSGEYWSLREAIKVCYNAPVQSYATDICSSAAIIVQNYFKKTPNRANLFFWVHDALLFDIRKEFAVEMVPKVMRIMENDCKIASDPVNYRTSCEFGYNYEYMSELKREEALQVTEEQINKKLAESLEKDANKKFKLIIKASGKILDKNYTKSEAVDKEAYFTHLVEKFNIPGVSTPQEYFCYMNHCSIEEYEDFMEFDMADGD